MNRRSKTRERSREPRTLALRLTQTLGRYDEVQMLRTGWLMMDEYRLQRLVITVESATRTEVAVEI